MIVVSATSSRYFFETQQMIYSCRGLLKQGTLFYILDTGLNANQRKILSNNFNFFEIKVIDIDSETSKDLGYFKSSYLFKAYMLDYALEINGYNHYIWLDAKTNLKYNENQIIKLCERQPILGIKGFFLEKDWTQIETVKAIIEDERAEEALNTNQTQASGILMRISNEKEMELYKEYKSYMNNKSILCPKGSSRANHRQDQSVLSCFLFKHGYKITEDWCLQHNTLYY